MDFAQEGTATFGVELRFDSSSDHLDEVDIVEEIQE